VTPTAAGNAGAAERFWIRADYRSRPAHSYDRAPGHAYWSPERIATSHSFQHPVYELARRWLLRTRAQSFLDVGSGPGTKVAELIAPHCEDVVLLDQPSAQALAARLLPGARFVAADLETLALQLGRGFDLIVCADVLEHLANPEPCLRFVREHLNPNGIAVLSTPERDRLRGRACRESPHPEHVREWNAAEFRAFVEHSGLRVLRQRLLPPRRCRGFERLAARLLGRWLRPRRFASCQVVVCRRGAAPGNG
jgi:2-polyprenyl-3-methyl-5-hydroxy-6-metoxy-1,4-benzoquinol methylase